MTDRWTPPKDTSSDKGRYVGLLQATFGFGWIHRQGVAYCRLCEWESGTGHQKGCPVASFPGSLWGK